MTEKSEEADDGGYTFSLAKGLRKRSASEADEDRYLAELKGKELSEKKTFQNRIRKQELKDAGRAAAGAAYEGLQAIGRGGVATGKYVASTEVAKYVGARAKGAIEYIPEKFEKARLDYQAGKISQKTYEDAYRQHQIEMSVTRGKAGEQRAYRKTQKKDIESVKKREIEFEAEKAYRKERARAMGRREVAQLDAVRKGQQVEPIQVPQFGVPPQRPTRQWARPRFGTGMVIQPTAQELDPRGIYSLNGMQQTTIQNERYDPTHLYKMLGYNPQIAQQVQPQVREEEVQQPVSNPKTQVQPIPRLQEAPVRANTSSFTDTYFNLNALANQQVKQITGQQVKPILIGKTKTRNNLDEYNNWQAWNPKTKQYVKGSSATGKFTQVKEEKYVPFKRTPIVVAENNKNPFGNMPNNPMFSFDFQGKVQEQQPKTNGKRQMKYNMFTGQMEMI